MNTPNFDILMIDLREIIGIFKNSKKNSKNSKLLVCSFFTSFALSDSSFFLHQNECTFV